YSLGLLALVVVGFLKAAAAESGLSRVNVARAVRAGALLGQRALLGSGSGSDSSKSSQKSADSGKPYDTCVCVFDFDETLRVISPDKTDLDMPAQDGAGIIRKCREYGWEIAVASANDNYQKLEKILSQRIDGSIFSPEFFNSSAFQYHWFNKTVSLHNIMRYYDTQPQCMMLFDDAEHNRKYADALGVTFIKARNDTGVRWDDFIEGQKYLHQKCWCAKPKDRSYSDSSSTAPDRNFTGKDRYGNPLPSNSSGGNSTDYSSTGGSSSGRGGSNNSGSGGSDNGSSSGNIYSSIGSGSGSGSSSGSSSGTGGPFMMTRGAPPNSEELLETSSDNDAPAAAAHGPLQPYPATIASWTPVAAPANENVPSMSTAGLANNVMESITQLGDMMTVMPSSAGTILPTLQTLDGMAPSTASAAAAPINAAALYPEATSDIHASAIVAAWSGAVQDLSTVRGNIDNTVPPRGASVISETDPRVSGVVYMPASVAAAPLVSPDGDMIQSAAISPQLQLLNLEAHVSDLDQSTG
ncbi:hypothetical protein Vafri_46, partial [Volvox africanus]